VRGSVAFSRYQLAASSRSRSALRGSCASRGLATPAVLRVDVAYLAVTLPPAAILTPRSDEGLEMVGIGLATSDYIVATTLVSLAFPSKMEKLRTRYLERKASGMPTQALVRQTEEDLRARAAEPNGSGAWGVVLILFGGSCVGLGLYDLLSNSTGDRTQSAFGTVLLGLGTAPLVGGVVNLFHQPESAAKQWWDVYQFGAPTRRASAVSTAPPSLSVTPIAHGALGTLRLSF